LFIFYQTRKDIELTTLLERWAHSMVLGISSTKYFILRCEMFS